MAACLKEAGSRQMKEKHLSQLPTAGSKACSHSRKKDLGVCYGLGAEYDGDGLGVCFPPCRGRGGVGINGRLGSREGLMGCFVVVLWSVTPQTRHDMDKELCT